VSSQTATSAMAPTTPSWARQRGRTNANAAIALSAKTAARGRRNAETGKSNQNAPKAHAMPISIASFYLPICDGDSGFIGSYSPRRG
jgi:hypothetical protein